MDADGRIHIDVALELAGEAICGSVCDGVSPPIEFSGWLELMSVFELARSAASALPDDPVRPVRGGGV